MGLVVEVFRVGGPVIRLPIGVRSPAWAARGDLIDAGMATAADVARWDAAFLRMDALPRRPWGSVPMLLAVGRRAT